MCSLVFRFVIPAGFKNFPLWVIETCSWDFFPSNYQSFDLKMTRGCTMEGIYLFFCIKLGYFTGCGVKRVKYVKINIYLCSLICQNVCHQGG